MAVAVITRAGSAEYADALAPLGLTVVEMPVTRAEPVAHRFRAGHELIAVASARAAASVAGLTGDVWAVGAATQRALLDHGVHARVPEGVVDGASLAAAIITDRSVAGVNVLVPRAEDGRPELAATLRAAGAIVDEVIVYRTMHVAPDDPLVAQGRAAILAGQAAVVIVLAPSQVRTLAAMVPMTAPLYCAIGETTAAALREHGVEPVVAATPTPAGIATALAAVYPRRT